jgi:Family of unknown function (DUF5996)
MPIAETAAWPRFPVEGWDQTGPTLHRFTQIVGKIRMTLTPPVNHFWHVPLYVTARGLTTSAIPYRSEVFEIAFDFVDQHLFFTTSWGPTRSFPLRSYSVAEFYAEVMATLDALGITVHIWTRAVEVPDPIPFEQDHTHATYDAAAAYALWRVLIRVDNVFKVFRGRFLGKCSPIHFFWGSFDLAVTRFSGRRGPMFTGPALNVNPHVMHESYSHEVSSAGFWPGNASAPPLFYSYAVPQPDGFSAAAVAPGGAAYSQEMGEFVLPYAAIQAADQPDQALLDFLQTTYSAAADLGGWDRVLLEEPPPCICGRATL